MGKAFWCFYAVLATIIFMDIIYEHAVRGEFVHALFNYALFEASIWFAKDSLRKYQ